MLEVFAVALGVGLVFNAAPGAVFTESLRRGVRGGFRPAFAVQVGSLVGDAVWAILGLAGVGALFTIPELRIPITIVGCGVLVWLGAQGMRAALAPTNQANDDAGTSRAGRSALMTGAAMSLGNPWNVVYWSGTAGAVGAVLGGNAPTAALMVFFVGFMVSSLLWCVVAAGGIALLRRALPPVAIRVIEGLCGLVLVVFAAFLGWSLAKEDE
jgi:chemosensory pili system protein ChpE